MSEKLVIVKSVIVLVFVTNICYPVNATTVVDCGECAVYYGSGCVDKMIYGIQFYGSIPIGVHDSITACVNEWPPYPCFQPSEIGWQMPGGSPSSSTGFCAFPTYHNPGSYTMTASICESTQTINVKVIGVGTLTPDKGTAIVYNNGDPITNTKYVLAREPGSTVTVTATPNPATTSLPSCWQLGCWLLNCSGTQLQCVVPLDTARMEIVDCRSTCSPDSYQTDANARKRVYLYVIDVDLDLDSDNDDLGWYPGRTTSEDQIENANDQPGKIIAVNNNDDDSDGLWDFADLNFPGGDSGLVPMVLELFPSGLPLDMITVTFSYDDQDPQDTELIGGVAYPASDSGALRIWKKAKSGSMNPASIADGGDWIPSGVSFSAELLGSPPKTLYVEAVDVVGRSGITVTLSIGETTICEDTVQVSTVRLGMAVDGNRDRSIDFERVEDALNPLYRFWVNDDNDHRHFEEMEYHEDDAEDGDSDFEDETIDCMRDLEDFARLQLQSEYNKNVISENDITYYFTVSGIKVFEAINLTDSYLTVVADAESQKDAPFVQSSPGSLPNSFFNDSGHPTIAAFIFEGCQSGDLSPTISIRYKGAEIASRSVRLNLHGIDWFYVSGAQTSNTTVFVHGWNMETWESRKYADTMVKRLWWQGYTGRCTAFFWPTLTGETTYNASELIAWQSGQGLRNFITSLLSFGPREVTVLAHSMGNVVSGEALRLSSDGFVSKYIATQAALPAHCYDIYSQTYKISGTTPNVHGHYWDGMVNAEYLASVRTMTDTHKYNFHNSQDWALDKWVTNNNFFKPDLFYGYDENSDPNTPNEYNQGIDEFEHGFGVLLFPADAYEIFARCAQSRSLALGTGSCDGFTPIDLTTIGFDNKHYSHSKQFRSYSADMWEYWSRVIAILNQ